MQLTTETMCREVKHSNPWSDQCHSISYTVLFCRIVDALLNAVAPDDRFLQASFIFLDILMLISSIVKFLNERDVSLNNASNKNLLVMFVCIILPVEYIFAESIFEEIIFGGDFLFADHEKILVSHGIVT